MILNSNNKLCLDDDARDIAWMVGVESKGAEVLYVQSRNQGMLKPDMMSTAATRHG
jgi:hypothetical protein